MKQILPVQTTNRTVITFSGSPLRFQGQNRPIVVLTVGGAVILLGSILGLIVGIQPEGILSALVVAITILVTATVAAIYWPIFDVRTFRIPGVFMFAYTFLILAPIPVVYANNPGSVRTLYVIATCTGFLCTIMGIVLTYHLFPSSSQRATNWLATPLYISPILRPIAIALLLCCLGILLLYIRQVGTLPIVQAIIGDSTTRELTLAREDGLKLIAGKIRYLFSATRNMLFPYTTLLILAISFSLRKQFWRGLFAVSLFASLLFSAATLEKSPVGALFIMVLVAVMILRGKRLSFLSLPLLAVAALIFPVFVIMAIYQFDIDIYRIAEALARRILYVPSDVLYYYFDYVPSQQDFLFGRTMPYISKLFPDGPFPIVTVVCQYAYQSSLASCSANAAYIGTLWADFAWFGIVAGGLVTGVVIQVLQTFAMRLPKSPQTVALQAMLVYQVIMLTSTSLSDFMESTGAMYALILTMLITLISQKPRPDCVPE